MSSTIFLAPQGIEDSGKSADPVLLVNHLSPDKSSGMGWDGRDGGQRKPMGTGDQEPRVIMNGMGGTEDKENQWGRGTKNLELS